MSTFNLLRSVDQMHKTTISRGASSLLSYIVRVQRADSWHYATGAALASALKVSERSISRWVIELREAGFLSVWIRKAKSPDGSMRYIARGFRPVKAAITALAVVGRSITASAVEAARARTKAGVAKILARFGIGLSKRSLDTVSDMTQKKDLKDTLKDLYQRAGSLEPGSAGEKEAWDVIALLEGGL